MGLKEMSRLARRGMNLQQWAGSVASLLLARSRWRSCDREESDTRSSEVSRLCERSSRSRPGVDTVSRGYD